MTFLPSLPADAALLDVLRVYPSPAPPLLDYLTASARRLHDVGYAGLKQML